MKRLQEDSRHYFRVGWRGTSSLWQTVAFTAFTSKILRLVCFGLVVSVFAGTAHADLLRGLTAYWKFEGTFEATIGGPMFDGNPSNGTSFSGSGQFGQAASFERDSAQYIWIPNPVITQGQDHTYSAWFKLSNDVTNINTTDRYFVLESTANSMPSSDTNYTISFGLRDISGDGLGDIAQVYTITFSGASHHLEYEIPLGTLNDWHNITVTLDSNNGDQDHTFYFDGDNVGSMSNASPNLKDTGGLVIGGHRGGVGRNWDGLIDEVAIWDRVLDPSEITALDTTAIIAPPFDQVVDPFPPDVTQAFDGPTYLAQTFTAGRSERLEKVDLLIYKSGGVGDLSDLVMEVRDTTPGGLPDSVLATGSLRQSSVFDVFSAPENVFVSVAVAGAVDLTADSRYAIVLRTADSSPAPGDDYFWARSSSELYAGGAGFQSSNSGGTWAAVGGDFGFKTTLIEDCDSLSVPSATFLSQMDFIGFGDPCQRNFVPASAFVDSQPSGFWWAELETPGPYPPGETNTRVRVLNQCHASDWDSVTVTILGCDAQTSVGGFTVLADSTVSINGNEMVLAKNVIIADPNDAAGNPEFHLGLGSEVTVDTGAGSITNITLDSPSIEFDSGESYPLTVSSMSVVTTPGVRKILFDGEFFVTGTNDGVNFTDLGLGGGGASFTLYYDQSRLSLTDGRFLNMPEPFSFLDPNPLLFSGDFVFDCKHFELSMTPNAPTSIDIGPKLSIPVDTQDEFDITLDVARKAFSFKMESSALDILGSSGLLSVGCGNLGVCGGLYLRFDPFANPPVGEVRVLNQLSVGLPSLGTAIEAGLTMQGQTFNYDVNCQEEWVPDPGGTFITVSDEIVIQGRMSVDLAFGNAMEMTLDEVDFYASTETDSLWLDVSGSAEVQVGPSGDPWFAIAFDGSGHLGMDWSDPYIIEGEGKISPRFFPQAAVTAEFDATATSGGYGSVHGKVTADVPIPDIAFLDNLAFSAGAEFDIDNNGFTLGATLDTPVFDADVDATFGKSSLSGSLTGGFGYKGFTVLAAGGSFYLDATRLTISAEAMLLCSEVGLTLQYETGDVVPSLDYKARFALCSPLELHFYDGSRHVGRNPSTGQIDLEIPGAVYVEDGSHSYIELPSYDIVTDSSRVFLDGYDTGAYSFVAHVPSSNSGEAHLLTYDGTVTTVDTNIELKLGAAAEADSFPIDVDLDGDGTPESSMNPTQTDMAQVDPSIPTLSNLAIAQELADGTAVTVTWDSSEPMTTQLMYGDTPSYSSATVEDTTLVTQHVVTLYGLTPGTTTHVGARSRSALGQIIVTPDASITTNLVDGDGDGWADNRDNCPTQHNPSQLESEGPGQVEDFEAGTFAGWSFAASTNGQQSGSLSPGDWASSITSDALDGFFSARLWARSDASQSPWQLFAAIERQFPVSSGFSARLRFDDIQGGGGTGASQFDVTFLNAANTSQAFTYRHTTTGGLGGDVSVLVNVGDEITFQSDIAADFMSKYGTVPSDVIVRFRARADYAEGASGSKVRTTDVLVDRVETSDAVYRENWESASMSDWSFEYSTNGQQSGSNAAATWSNDITNDPLGGSYSVELSADAHTNVSPFGAVSGISRTVVGGQRLLARVAIDEIQDISANGHSIFVIFVKDDADPSRQYIWHFTGGAPVGGDANIPVSQGDVLDLDLDLAGALFGKYGVVPAAVQIAFRTDARYATDGPRSARVRIDPIIVTRGGLVGDGFGDACDTQPFEWNPSQDGAVSVEEEVDVPRRYRLHFAVPNPFNGRTRISYEVPRSGVRVQLRIYDVRGRLVRKLVDESAIAGRWTVYWDGRDRRNADVPSGVYLYRLDADDFRFTRKLIYLK